MTASEVRRIALAHPNAVKPASGAWGRQGHTRIELAHADSETVGDAMMPAWQNSRANRPTGRS